MGIKGSSTRQVFFSDCKVPAENLLGEIGKGHKIAFNILNIGRLKLCAAAIGGARRSMSETVQYAKTREQFKQPISNFGAIKHKLAENGRILIRASGTEPLLRVMVEAREESVAQQAAEQLAEAARAV